MIYLDLEDLRLRWTNDEAYDFIIAVSSGTVNDVTEMAWRIAAAIRD